VPQGTPPTKVYRMMEGAKIDAAPPSKEDYENVRKHTMVENEFLLYL